jgi:hypothetical protein
VAVLQERIRVETAGQTIVAQIIGEPTKELISERHRLIVAVHQSAGFHKVLFNDLKMSAPANEAIEAQRTHTCELGALKFKIAVVVPDYQLAYLARLQFGDENHRVFYDDIAAAFRWLDAE